MTVFLNRRGEVVAAFVHRGDVIQYEQQNQSRGYEQQEEPGLEDEVNRRIAQKPVDASWQKRD